MAMTPALTSISRRGFLFGCTAAAFVGSRISEVVFFEPTDRGPVCLWARDGDTYYFANQIAGHEAMVKWLAKVQGR